MQGSGSMKCGPVQISRGQPYPRCEVFEPNYLVGNPMLAHPDIEGKHWKIHEPPMIPPITVQSRRRPTGRVVAEEPHVRSVGIELGLDVRKKVMASIDDHPNVRRVQPASSNKVTEAAIPGNRRLTRS